MLFSCKSYLELHNVTNICDTVLFFICKDGMFKLQDAYRCNVLVAKALDFESRSSYLLNITASNVSMDSLPTSFFVFYFYF